MRVKRVLAAALRQVLAPRCDTYPRQRSGRPVVAGFLRSPSGIGESARLCLRALDRLGLDPGGADLSARFQPREMLLPEGRPADFAQPGPLVLHVNPPELPAAALHLGRRALTGRLVVGYWAWELEQVPDPWRRGLDFVHEIWVPSVFCAEAVRAITTKPVRVVAHPLPSFEGRFDRDGLGLPTDGLLILTVCDLRSSIARKNLAGAVVAFRRAFPAPGRARLVVKLSGYAENAELYNHLAHGLLAGEDVVMITRTLSPTDMDNLLASVDVVLSLHRSEGFGLVPARAMQAGKAVVATDWSGSRDFLTEESAATVPCRLVPVDDPQGIYPFPGLRWAEPDSDAAAAALARLADDGAVRWALGQRARDRAARLFSDDAFAQALGTPFWAAVGRPQVDTEGSC